MFRPSSAQWRWRAAVLAACVGVVVSTVAGIAVGAYISLIHADGPVANRSQIVASDDQWMQSVRSGEYFRKQSPSIAPAPRPEPSAPRHYFRSPMSEPTYEARATYRTMCVRLCDGYAWPISFATTRGNFSQDEKACQQSCESPTKLYFHRNPGEELEDMVDVDGKPYSALPTAYFYRAVYDDSCKCRPHAWEQESLERHRIYALEQRARKGDKAAGAELRSQKTRSAEAAREGERRSTRR